MKLSATLTTHSPSSPIGLLDGSRIKALTLIPTGLGSIIL